MIIPQSLKTASWKILFFSFFLFAGCNNGGYCYINDRALEQSREQRVQRRAYTETDFQVDISDAKNR